MIFRYRKTELDVPASPLVMIPVGRWKRANGRQAEEPRSSAPKDALPVAASSIPVERGSGRYIKVI